MKYLPEIIKNRLLTIVLLSFIFASCSEDDRSGSSEKNEINLLTKVQTKTSSINVQLPNNQTIGVFLAENAANLTTAYKQNLLFTADGSGNLSGETQQYPQNGNNILISAYHPYSDATSDTYTFSVAQDQVPDENSYASDLLFCSEFTQAFTVQPVILSFKHKLSLITYKLNAGEGSPDLTGAKVNAVNVATSIDFNRKTGALGAISNTAEVSFDSEGGIIVPQTIAAGKQFIKIKLMSGEEMHYVPEQNLVLEPGKKYTFSLKVNKTSKIVSPSLTTVVEDWAVGFELNGEANEGTGNGGDNDGKVVFREDFNGSTIDENIWKIGAWVEHGGQLSRERCFVKDGYLNLLFINDNGNFLSSAIQSKGEFLYGKWETRLKPASEPGVLNSFYTIDWDDREMDGKDDDGSKQEIDIEFLTRSFTPGNGEVHFAVHASGLPSFGTKPDINLEFNPSDDFHVWAINITPEFIEWSVDGKVFQVYRYKEHEIKIDKPYSLKLNHWSAVNWIQGPPKSGVKCEYLIDWIQFTTYDN